ncbi:type IV pilus modification PilV family protein [Thermus sp.]
MKKGLTILEVLIALAVLGIAFAALLTSQLTNLRTSAQARFASDTKAFAVQVLEKLSAEALKTENVSSDSDYVDEEYVDEDGNRFYRSFYFIDYYYKCPTRVTPPSGSGIRTNLRSVTCSGQETSPEGIRADWDYIGEGGQFGEGVLTVVVTATHPRGPRVTVGRRITCYDVYPSPTHDKPRPCPNPGGGRP